MYYPMQSLLYLCQGVTAWYIDNNWPVISRNLYAYLSLTKRFGVICILRLCPLQLFIVPLLNNLSLILYPSPCLSLKPDAAMVTERWHDKGIRLGGKNVKLQTDTHLIYRNPLLNLNICPCWCVLSHPVHAHSHLWAICPSQVTSLHVLDSGKKQENPEETLQTQGEMFKQTVIWV